LPDFELTTSSGQFQGKESISKKDSRHLRKTLFQIMDILIQNHRPTNIIYQFLDRKRAKGKRYYSYMNAGAVKLLRVYYARVKEYLTKPILKLTVIFDNLSYTTSD
jgi:hypothetical protein